MFFQAGDPIVIMLDHDVHAPNGGSWRSIYGRYGGQDEFYVYVADPEGKVIFSIAHRLISYIKRDE